MSSNGLLAVEDLVVHYVVPRGLVGTMARRPQKLVRAVDGVSFSVGRGELLALVGESGCGKTTTAQTVLRLLDPVAGRISFDGEDITTLPNSALRPLRRRMQIIYQDPYESLDPRLTVKSTVEEPLLIHRSGSKRERAELVRDALARVELTPPDLFLERFPHELSGGQRQRVAIAASIVLGPDLLVADEPVSMLDVSVRAGVLRLLDSLREAGLGILMITHDLSTAARFADRIAVMYLGRIVEEGPAEAVVRDPQHPYTKALLSVVPRRDPRDRSRPLILTGEAPDAIRIPRGCRFHPRCPLAIADCREIDPLLERHGAATGAPGRVHPRWLNRSVGGIGAASFCSPTSGRRSRPRCCPSFLTSTLGAPAAALGAIEGVADGLAGAARLAGGALADDPRRRRATAVGGYSGHRRPLRADRRRDRGLAGRRPARRRLGGARAARARRATRCSPTSCRASALRARLRLRARDGQPRRDRRAAARARRWSPLVGVRAAILLSIIPGLLAVAAIFYAIRHTPKLDRARAPPSAAARAAGAARASSGGCCRASAFELGNIAATLLILRATDLLDPGARPRLRRQGRARPLRGLQPRRHARQHPRRRATATGAAVRVSSPAGVACFALAYARLRRHRRERRRARARVRARRRRDRLRGDGRARRRGDARARETCAARRSGCSRRCRASATSRASAVAGALWTLVSPAAAFLYLGAWMLVSAVALIPRLD